MTEEERLKEFLLAIHMHQGRVCGEYETCKHAACASNHATWELADAALQGMTLEQYRTEKNKLFISTASAFKCFKCGLYGVGSFSPDENPKCGKCGTFDVVLTTIERTPNGTINNCALSCGLTATDCEMCNGSCPDRARFGSYR